MILNIKSIGVLLKKKKWGEALSKPNKTVK
jgi:hypothetical protein